MAVFRAEMSTQPQPESDRRREFGQRVRALRKAAGLNRDQLAERTQIPFKTIGDIERGEKVLLDVEWVINPLADFFQLSGLTREEFFAAAGLRLDVLQPEDNQDYWSELLTHFYKSTKLPALVTDPLYNFHSSNSYLNAIYGFDAYQIHARWSSGAGFNMIRLLFDPDSGFRSMFGTPSGWREAVVGNTYSFRVSAISRLGTPALEHLLSELEKLPDFAEIWQYVSAPGYRPRFTGIPMICYPDTPREMQFVGAYIFQARFDNMEQHRILYVPADDATARKVDQIRATVPPAVYHYSKRFPNGVREIKLD
ncbi:MAG: helix-turn-helix domain-containing protein [Anaerolineae bacterium]|nr:helix-turn-helix domain-containing protein [Anaerolineae bacterium]